MTIKHDTGIVIRSARPDEADALTELCRAAKRHWGYPEEWMREWLPELTVTPEMVREQVLAVAELDGIRAGFYGLRRDMEGGWHLEHLWLEPQMIGRGLGRVLFEAAVAEAGRRGIAELRIKSDPNAEPFYLKMGAVRVDTEVYQLLGRHRREVPLMIYRVPAAQA
jgi:GNAT superfamily N-acetyltransferase